MLGGNERVIRPLFAEWYERGRGGLYVRKADRKGTSLRSETAKGSGVKFLRESWPEFDNSECRRGDETTQTSRQDLEAVMCSSMAV